MVTYQTNSERETKLIAKKLAKRIHQGVVALTGNLGAGKTTFVQGFALGLGIKEKIISPTFVLIKQHPIPDTNNVLYHIDLYRLEENDQLKNLGLEELINNPNNLLIIEWAEKLKKLPKKTIKINIEREENNNRLIIIS